MKLSVILPCYNVGRFVRLCLDSLAEAFALSSIDDYEIIVVNDGSTDGSEAVIRDYQEKIIFGLSIRQLGFTSLAVAVGIGSYFVLTHLLSVPLSIASYCIVAVCAPFMALGFIRIHGRTFEQHLLLVYRHRKHRSQQNPSWYAGCGAGNERR